MNFRQERLSLAKAKETDMVSYLFELGHEPTKIKNNDYWYRSPLREEQTPSFKVNRELNLWYDHGLGKGGNLIDFGILYHQCSVTAFLQKLNESFSFQQLTPTAIKAVEKQEFGIRILGDFSLTSHALLKYLEERKIPIAIAEQYCREVRYELNQKTFYGIGFKNDSGGYEIRNSYFKAGSSPKDITTFTNDSDAVAVFEGFTDFLSFKTFQKDLPENRADFVILNSLSLFERAKPFMEQHKAIRLYLDRDAAGLKLTQHTLALSSKYKDESHLYKNHKDLNEWLVDRNQSQKKHLRQRLR